MPEEERKNPCRNTRLPKFFVFGLFFALFFLFFIGISPSFAAPVPSIITYQGKLLVGGSAATTTQSMYFVLYDSASGGTALYSSAGTTSSPSSISVTPNSGLFSVNLGDAGTNALDPAIFQDNTSVYLEVRIGSGPDILSPRKKITASPYSINSMYLNGFSASTGTPSSAYIPVSDNSGNFSFNHVTSTGISAGTSSFSAVTLNGITKTDWPAAMGYFFNLTPGSYNGAFSITIGTTTYSGYQAANHICNSVYSGSHFCRTDEIIATISDKDISTLFTTGLSGWEAQGPPGYTANSNDCNGWMSSNSSMLGAFWLYNTGGGGAGWLVNCSVTKPISCCK